MKMQTFEDSYLDAYRCLSLTRDSRGVLVVRFHTGDGPLVFTAQDHAGLVATEVVLNGKALDRARELAGQYLKVPEVTRRNTRIHFMQPLKERIVREVGYGLSLEGASAADLVKSMQAKS